ncbi:hypothetical protein [Proteus alimentorum]|uniref:hypothetical protein n=1 Tax=Proteus alimentorum TaxID=1973495 RepID=UPI000C00023B|nr:hypothetical protein [Proteus alimentorum]
MNQKNSILRDGEIYTRIGKIFYSTPLEEVKKIILDAEFSGNNDCVTFLFYYTNKKVEKSSSSYNVDCYLMDNIIDLN